MKGLLDGQFQQGLARDLALFDIVNPELAALTRMFGDRAAILAGNSNLHFGIFPYEFPWATFFEYSVCYCFGPDGIADSQSIHYVNFKSHPIAGRSATNSTSCSALKAWLLDSFEHIPIIQPEVLSRATTVLPPPDRR
ncbi:MAG TPA: hypothetical protein P5326_13395, partial [Candidatus Contendobacter sp.]|nr:hypothetical protein [Candidatus Contendobacter sp.]